MVRKEIRAIGLRREDYVRFMTIVVEFVFAIIRKRSSCKLFN